MHPIPVQSRCAAAPVAFLPPHSSRPHVTFHTVSTAASAGTGAVASTAAVRTAASAVPVSSIAPAAIGRAPVLGSVSSSPAVAPAPQGIPWRAPTTPSVVAAESAGQGTKTVTWTEAGPYSPVVIGPGTDFDTLEEYFAPPLPKWGDPYAAMLQFLEQAGWFQGLPLDESGTLRVSCPFCAGFMECQILLPFLARLFLGRPDVSGLSILGSDLAPLQGGKWPQKEQYAKRKFPRMELQLRKMDLAHDPLPECALTIGVHPEATRDQIWGDIFANIMRSMKHGGVCIIATYFEVEMQAVQRLCEPLGVQFQVYENPYYKSHALDRSPSLRFLLVTRCKRG
mmetsp:Transcript_109818/g.321580  ORF Transcript_109818/g.321580 Transcript_109818/m.321580 type:complete len:339 (+) Transcript_109818:115-1131(+)